VREGDLEVVKKKIQERVESVSGKIKNYAKGVKPFGAVKLDPIEQIYIVDNLTNQQIRELVEEFGPEPVYETLMRVEKLRRQYYA